MRNILGLDIGTNSIGWAFINWDSQNFTGKIVGMGSRIIPTDAELLSNFETGLAASKNAGRRQARGARRMQQRYKLRRARLIETLKLLQWLPNDFNAGTQLPVPETLLNEMKAAFGQPNISADWVVYYLRHKALQQAVTREELARILYHMNQRRGFKSNRKANNEVPVTENEEEETGRKKRVKTVEIVTVTRVEDSGEKYKGLTVYLVHLADGRKAQTLRKTPPDWTGEKELELTWVPPTKKEPERWECRLPEKTDWQNNKEALEKDIAVKGLMPGDYFFNELKKNPEYRVKERIIDRKFYEQEITQILNRQRELQPELFPEAPVIHALAQKLYPHNLQKQQEIRNNGLEHLLLNDIIYYQRPLKSQKHSIAVCRYETAKHTLDNGVRIGVRVAPASSPVFQEFRIWQTVNNLRILQRETRGDGGRLLLETDVTEQYIDAEKAAGLFELFNSREKVNQKQILKQLGGLSTDHYLVNLFRNDEEKEIPGNETLAVIRKALKRAGMPEPEYTSILANPEAITYIWHVLYSLDSEAAIVSALTPGHRQKPVGFTAAQAAVIARTPAFKPQFAALSAKAMNKLLPLMRTGKYWNAEAIDAATRSRIDNIIDGVYDAGISDHTRNLFIKKHLTRLDLFQGLQTPMAAYAVYGVHSEKDSVKLTAPGQIVTLTATELRNPVVTQVVNETLRTVRDIWARLGRPQEIHIELGRDLKKNAKERAEQSNRISSNRRENERVAAILRELKLGGNPNSPGDIEKLKLWEQQAGAEAREAFKEIRFKRPSEPTRDELEKYKLWCNQQHLSPYSGQVIPISRLFTTDYEVDHIIPRSRYFDDSFDNKVVVESWLNKEKDNKTAYAYILGGSAKGEQLLSAAEYEAHVNRYFYGKKKRLLLSEQVPEGFIERQLNDTKYITRKLNELMGAIAEDETAPVVVTNGVITNELKNRWGLAEKMKAAVKWRFERLGEKTGKELVSYAEAIKNERPTGKKILRLEGYEKRIDHRHHALDALVIACTTRSHIRYINTLNAQQADVLLKDQLAYLLDNPPRGRAGTYTFKQPWPGFVAEAEQALAGIVISFKNDIRITGKRSNRTVKYVQDEQGNWVKTAIKAEGKTSPAVRQSLHKATFAGKIHLPAYKLVNLSEALRNGEQVAFAPYREKLKALLSEAGGDEKKALKMLKENPLVDEAGNPVTKLQLRVQAAYFVNRVALNDSFDERKIGKIPDAPLAALLLKHLEKYGGNPKEAFGQEGLEALNKARTDAGKKPIRKVRIKEESSSKFEISPGKWVEADKGTNLFFAIYEKVDEPGNRVYETIPLRTVIEARLHGDGQFIERREGYRYFVLSPNDLVYMPDEGENVQAIDWEKDRPRIAAKIYKMVSATGNQCFFVPQTVSQVIEDKVEFDSKNKIERGPDNRMIKQFCIKLKTDRLGNIKPA